MAGKSEGNGAVDEGRKMVTTPVWKWEWNLNTVVILCGFASWLFVGGMIYNQMRSTSYQNAQNIERLDRRITILEPMSRIIDNHELRLTSVERQASESVSSQRSMEGALNSLASDMKVTKEILQRIEARRP